MSASGFAPNSTVQVTCTWVEQESDGAFETFDRQTDEAGNYSSDDGGCWFSTPGASVRVEFAGGGTSASAVVEWP